MSSYKGFSIRGIGAATIDSVLRLGYATRFIARTLRGDMQAYVPFLIR